MLKTKTLTALISIYQISTVRNSENQGVGENILNYFPFFEGRQYLKYLQRDQYC